ncbi:Hypothetical_protein [Hexamita inflata]|uniref:Hypothetical_protein n=1 Tax=Hexamita inflata TaxID=28002 RepID=A0AA86UJ80_9EUKA|nr:Hypothetical protein HINF_LOCUS29715 [Hexamita inflata]CAI9942073.1 Hypothetical protein HINF_LOCUS29718 [Hexamita inflata]
MSSKVCKVTKALSQLLQVPNVANKVIFELLMLSDEQYSTTLEKLQSTLQLSKINVQEVVMQLTLENMTSPSLESATSQYSKTFYNLLENRPRTQSKTSIQFQTKFSTALQQILETSITDNRELCILTNEYLQHNDYTEFWVAVHQLIPEKKPAQLRDYFQKSFQRFMYQEYITCEDKLILRDLIASMSSQKPAEIAGTFLDMFTEKNYFKRNVVMYIVNSRK